MTLLFPQILMDIFFKKKRMFFIEIERSSCQTKPLTCDMEIPIQWELLIRTIHNSQDLMEIKVFFITNCFDD